jgi:hypothetical protein
VKHLAPIPSNFAVEGDMRAHSVLTQQLNTL